MRSKRTVLIIDDEKLVMELYVRALEQKGFKVKQCYSPDEAFKFLSKTEPAIVIVDLMMLPGKKYKNQDTNDGLSTGFLLIHDIIELIPQLPIIVLTNVSNRETLSSLPKKTNLKLVVQKLDCPPFDLAEIVEQVLADDY